MQESAQKPLKPLKSQVAVVTGASRGMGAAIAEKLAAMGATIVLGSRSRKGLEATARAISQQGGSTSIVECDLTDLHSVEALAAYVDRTYQRADILVNNAGTGGFREPLHKLSPEAWDGVMNTNLRGVFYTIRSFAPLMIRAKSGHIINISSLASKSALPNGAAYAASKWGLNGLTYSVAEELRSYNIRVATVCPGTTNTELSPHEGKDPAKMLQPEDIAHAVATLVTQAPQSFISEILVRPTMKP